MIFYERLSLFFLNQHFLDKLYLILSENNNVYLTEYESDIGKFVKIAGWSYCYVEGENSYKIFSKEGKSFTVRLNGQELEIMRDRQSNASGTNFEEMLNGTYEKIE